MDNNTTVRLGEYLRSERERKNITIEQIASATKINVKLLHALESDSYETLPAKPFVRGFIANYARYIGLEPNEVIQKFDHYLDEQAGQKFKRPANAPHIFVDRESSADNSRTALTIIMSSFLVIGLVVMAVLKPSMKSKHGHHSGKISQINNSDVFTVPMPPGENSVVVAPPRKEVVKEAAKETTKPQEALAPAPKPPVATPSKSIMLTPPPAFTVTAQNPPPVAAPETKNPPVAAETTVTAAPKAQPSAAASASAATNQKSPPIPANEVKHKLVIHALVDSWVKYQSDDRPLMGFILKKDKTIYIKARNNIRFMSGNPKGVEYSYNGSPFLAFKDNIRSIIVPKESEKDFQDKMFTE